MKKIKLIYITTDNISLVQEGQVYNLLEYYQTLDCFSEIVLLQPYWNNTILQKAKSVLSRYSFRKEFFYARPLAPNVFFKNLKSLKSALVKELTDDCIIHSRGSLTSPFIRLALPKEYKNTYILTEFRGLVIDEIKVAHRHRLIDYFLAYCIKVPYARFLLNKLYKDPNSYFTVVSPHFKQVIEKEGFPGDRISIHPNIVSLDFIFSENDRKIIRQKYGLSADQPVAVMSSGGGTIWQKDHEIMERLLQMGFVVFNLGKYEIKREGVINGYLPRSEMPKYLSAADVAVLWREDIPLNNVACPSKFGEFVTMGLYVIHNGTVDIARRFIEEHDAGVIVSSPDEIHIDMNILNLNIRNRRCMAGYNIFSVEKIAKSYITHYQNKN